MIIRFSQDQSLEEGGVSAGTQLGMQIGIPAPRMMPTTI